MIHRRAGLGLGSLLLFVSSHRSLCPSLIGIRSGRSTASKLLAGNLWPFLAAYFLVVFPSLESLFLASTMLGTTTDPAGLPFPVAQGSTWS